MAAIGARLRSISWSKRRMLRAFLFGSSFLKVFGPSWQSLRRKTNIRGSAIVDPVIIDPRMMDALDRYMALHIDDVSCLIAKFLNLYLTDTPYLEPYEVDNFILRNGRFLAFWYVANCGNISLTSLFVVPGSFMTSSAPRYRVSELYFYWGRWSWTRSPFNYLYMIGFFPGVVGSDGASRTKVYKRHLPNRYHRLLAVTRLFRIMLDVISQNFTVEDRQWRSSVNDIFSYFFTARWADERARILLFYVILRLMISC